MFPLALAILMLAELLLVSLALTFPDTACCQPACRLLATTVLSFPSTPRNLMLSSVFMGQTQTTGLHFQTGKHAQRQSQPDVRGSIQAASEP